MEKNNKNSMFIPETLPYFIASWSDDTFVYTVLDKFNITVRDLITKLKISDKNSIVPEAFIRCVIYHSVNGLKKLWDLNKRAHGDFRPENIYLAYEFYKDVPPDMPKTGAFYRHLFKLRTKLELPKNVLNNRPDGDKQDVWSLGISLIELINQQYPFDEDNYVYDIKHKTAKINKKKQTLGKYSRDLSDFINNCLIKGVDDNDIPLRWSYDKIILHKYYKKCEKNCVQDKIESIMYLGRYFEIFKDYVEEYGEYFDAMGSGEKGDVITLTSGYV